MDMPGNSAGTKFRHWGHEETLHLIEIWGEPSMQLKFDNMTRKETLYKEIEKELKNRGHSRTVAQVKEKLHALKAKYKECWLKVNKSGAGDFKIELSFPFYYAMDNVIGKRPAINPTNVSDSIIVDEDTTVVDDAGEGVLHEGEIFNSLDSFSTQSEESDKPGPSSKRKKEKFAQELDSVVEKFLEREQAVFKEENENFQSMKDVLEKRHKEDLELRNSQFGFMKEHLLRESERKDKLINLMEKFLEPPSKKKK